MAKLRSPNPSLAVGALLIAEVLLFIAAAMAYIWFFVPTDPKQIQWHHVAIAALLGAIPIALNLLHGDCPRDSGLRLDNFWLSAREVGVVTLLMATGIVAFGLATDGFKWISWARLGEKFGMYVFWGPMQQYLLQAFALRRLRQSGLSSPEAVILAAAVFGLLHYPNWTLVAATTGGGIVWCILFLRRPNIITLGLAHAALAVLIYHSCYQLTMGMTIGPFYVNRVLTGWH